MSAGAPRLTPVALLAALLCGCVVGPRYHPPTPNIPARWSEAPQESVPASDSAFSSWWKCFNDPQLESLIERSLRGNLDLQLAEARIREARASRVIATARRLPAVNTTASYARQRDSLNAPAAVLVQPDGRIEPEAGQPES